MVSVCRHNLCRLIFHGPCFVRICTLHYQSVSTCCLLLFCFVSLHILVNNKVKFEYIRNLFNVQNIPTLELGQAQMFFRNLPPCPLSDNGRCNPVGNDGSGHQQQRSKPLERRPMGMVKMVQLARGKVNHKKEGQGWGVGWV